MNALGTKTTLRLLKVLFEDPLHEFMEIELIRKAETGKGSANKLINDLVKKEIVLEKRIGKAKIIYLNLCNKQVFLLKNLFDQEKLAYLSNSKLASILLFTERIKEKSGLLLVFGSSITKTATEKSDIDIMVANKNFGTLSNNLDKAEEDLDTIHQERKKIEELFGERFNLHCYTKEEIKTKIKSDIFIQNAVLKGVFFHGYDLGIEIFSSMKEKRDLERLFFLNDRIKSAIRNYLNKDHKTAEEILDRTLEQMIYYLLSEKEISYASRKDAKELIKKFPEGKFIQKITKFSLKEQIMLSEKFILDILKDRIISGKGYGRRD